MSRALLFRNRQRARKFDLRVLRGILESFLENFAGRKGWELGIHFVDGPAIKNLNETWLHHRGPTDVITFDYNDPQQPEVIAGDIFICVPEAIRHAKQFRATWQSEIIRYIVHGVLHLSGFDDCSALERKRMKVEEDRMLHQLEREFDFRRIGGESGRKIRKSNEEVRSRFKPAKA